MSLADKYDPRTGTITEDSESKWFVSEDRLNPDQQRFLSSVDIDRQNVWIQGFAGSGKSILLVHVARKILAAKPNAKIVLVVYTQSLVEMFKTALRELKLYIPVMTYYSFMNSSLHYDYIICDEVQDLTPSVLDRMNKTADHVIVAGDSNQSIYTEDPKWKEKTVDASQIPTLINCISFLLTIIERLTESIMKAVKSFMQINIFESRVNLNHTDTQITLWQSSSINSEISNVIQHSTRVTQRGYTAAVLIPTQKKIVEFVNSALISQGKPIWDSVLNSYNRVDFGAMNRHLASCGIKMQYVGNGYGSFNDNAEYVVLMTYHSSKGLDFDYVYLPFCNDSLWISKDAVLSKTLFMVAITRARMNLNISYTGRLHPFVQPFSTDCRKRTI